MIRILALGLLSLIALLAVQAPPATTQESHQRDAEEDDSNGGLQISISLDCDRFRPSDSPRLKVELKNVRDTALIIHKDVGWYGDSSFSLSITDGRGKPVVSRFLGENFPTSPIPEEEFITLKPGGSHTQERTLLLKYYMFEASGVYSLTATYHGPTKHFVPDSLKEGIWGGGPIKSKPVKVEIVKD
jgi:hypothetical protein